MEDVNFRAEIREDLTQRIPEIIGEIAEKLDFNVALVGPT